MRYVPEGTAIELLGVHFGLSAPVAFDDVKKVYRKKSKLLHPDAGGTEDEFKLFSGAFDTLKQLYQTGSRLFDAEPVGELGKLEQPSMPRVTVDGTPLCDLGLGLGPTTNGTDCKHCERRGYTVVEEKGKVSCPTCDGMGLYLHPVYGRRNCCTCDGHGRVYYKHAKLYVLMCGTCHGTGEIKIYNPVLPKGRLTFNPERDAA